MVALNITLDGDGAWPDLVGKDITHLANDAEPVCIAVISEGTSSGKPSIAFRFDLPDGQTVVFETTWALLGTAAQAIAARYGWP